MYRTTVSVIAALSAMMPMRSTAAESGNAARGERVFRSCVACHSLQPDRNMTGPSLSGLWDRQAGGLASFSRYSSALKSSGIIWQDNSLNEWLKEPQQFIPDNRMTIPGIKDAQARADLLAFLKDRTRPGQAAPSPSAEQKGGTGNPPRSGGGRAEVPNLRKPDPDERVQSINYCGDTYKVTTADGKTRDFWERNLRFKTDSSAEGPEKGAPAIIGAGMMGDRASVIFTSPEEISGFIKHEC